MSYFDHNATTPLVPRARAAWLQAQDEAWQNPSSPYREAARVRARLEQAREQLARLLGCATETVIFTSGATEGNNAVLAHLARTLPPGKKLAVSPTEHPCVLAAAETCFAGRDVRLEIDRDGVVKLDRLEALLSRGGIGAVSVMAANNETGVAQPWPAIARLCRRLRVACHCDASQWLGKLPAAGLGETDWVVGTAHKFGGPKGVGFLKRAAPAGGFRSFSGGEQEHGQRAGTENYPGIAAMVAALIEAEEGRALFETQRLRWRGEFEQAVRAALPEVRVIGATADRLWNTVSLLLPHTENHRWVAKLDKLGFQVSTGSACASGSKAPSHVLAAMGYAPDEAKRVIRVSAGWGTTEEEWQRLVGALSQADAGLRATAAPGVIAL